MSVAFDANVTVQTQSFGGRYAAFGPVFVRLALAISLVVSGVGKVFNLGPKAFGIEGFAGYLAGLGVPAPGVLAWVVGGIELVGGLLILVGLLTRVSAALAAVTMAAATVLAHAPNGFVVSEGGFEYTLALTLIAASLVCSGPGALSVERAVFGRELVFGGRSADGAARADA